MSELRKDLQNIAHLVPKGARLLELGCGDGELLQYLLHKKSVDGRGIEISQSGVSKCVKNGLSVIQGDADTDLQYYPDSCFDYCVSSQVLQATRHPKEVLQEMMRISKHAIISTPNFGYWYNRLYLVLKGRMPVSSTLSYQWYETPNIHFSTLKDFDHLCRELGYKIEKKIYLQPSGEVLTSLFAKLFPNLFSEKCIFVLGRY
ncbi:MAG: methionine biosynthesis protein MetW [Rickettsiaceae bacterium]|jgi:methionine biosynthesis protein MetW|nr:methionine biosynthesis protein MetW [Rickettsiaceae bacterium]